MSNKKQHSDLIIQMPLPAFSSRFGLDQDQKNEAKEQAREIGSDQVKEALIEKIAEHVDHALALTGEPFSFVISILDHISQASEIAHATQKMGGKSFVIISAAARQQQHEDDEIEFFT